MLALSKLVSILTFIQLYTATLDNTSNNNTTCKVIEGVHVRRGLEWNSDEQQLPFAFIIFRSFIQSHLCHSCLAHVVNVENIDVMSHITKIAAVKNATAIWEYDPTLVGNRVLGGSLDIIAAIHTLAIKVSNRISLVTYRVSKICRFKRLGNASNTSTAPNSVVDFPRL